MVVDEEVKEGSRKACTVLLPLLQLKAEEAHRAVAATAVAAATTRKDEDEEEDEEEEEILRLALLDWYMHDENGTPWRPGMI